MSNINWRISDSVVSSSGSQPISGSYTQTGSAEIVINQNFSANTTKQLLSITFGKAGNNSGNLQAFILLASQNITIYTNNANSPQDTISLTAGIPLEWDNSLIYTCPFSNSVSAFYITSNTASNLQGKFLTF